METFIITYHSSGKLHQFELSAPSEDAWETYRLLSGSSKVERIYMRHLMKTGENKGSFSQVASQGF